MEWDDDGYPTDESLEEISKWQGADFNKCFTAIKPIWKYSAPAAWCGWHESDAEDEIRAKPVRTTVFERSRLSSSERRRGWEL